jgi:hypothetical protein
MYNNLLHNIVPVYAVIDKLIKFIVFANLVKFILFYIKKIFIIIFFYNYQYIDIVIL